MQKQLELSKLINLLVEFEEKLEALIHKKYKTFVRSIINMNTLKKNITTDLPFITKEIIVFKLGLQSKSVKCIQLTLQYLYKILDSSYIDLNGPDFSQHYVICQNEVKQIVLNEYNNTAKRMLHKVLTPLVHFKNDQINIILAKNLQFFVGENILDVILLLCNKPPPNYPQLLNSYFSIRFYLLDQLIIYTEKQLRKIHLRVPKNDKTNQQIKKALQKRSRYESVIQMYVLQIIDKVVQDGGKFGFCVMCRAKADFYCKDTKASLCGAECKGRHLNIAKKYNEEEIKANLILKQLIESLKQLFQFIGKQEKQIKSKLILVELVNILIGKPYLFLFVKEEILSIFKQHIPRICKILIQSNTQYLNQLAFIQMCSITKYYNFLFFNQIQTFLIEQIVEKLQEKKPKPIRIGLIMQFFMSLFQNGKNFIQLYVNFDCKINRENIMERLMFEFAKILQDKFTNLGYFSRNEKSKYKLQCLQIHSILAENLFEYKKNYRKIQDISSIMLDKNKKISIQKFVFKFNENWSSGIKTLFNLNLVNLDNLQIYDILKSTSKLKKTQLESYFFNESHREILNIHLSKVDLKNNNILQSLIQFYQLFPIKNNQIISQKIFVEQYFQIHHIDKVQEVQFWLKNFNKELDKLTVEYFKEQCKTKGIELSQQNIQIYLKKIANLQKPVTVCQKPSNFQYCNSKSYIEIIQGQLNLLQISISHLLEGWYELSTTLNLMKNLQSVCSNANLFLLLIKSTNFQYIQNTNLVGENILMINYLIETPEQIPDSISQWLSILRFYNDLYYFSVMPCLNPILLANKNLIVSSSSLNKIESNLLKISSKIDTSNYKKFILALLKIGYDEASSDRTFLLQKFFQLIENSHEKLIKCWNDIFPKISTTALNICVNLNTQMSIYMIDLLKQNIIKLLQLNIEQQLQSSYFELLFRLYEELKTSQAKQFLFSCIAMIIQHHFSLYLTSWKIVIKLMIDGAKSENLSFKSIVYTIIQKIMSQNLLFLLDYFQEIFSILMMLINNLDSKISIKSLIDIRILIDFLIKQSSGTQNSQSPMKEVVFQSSNKQLSRKMLYLMLPKVLLNLSGKLNSQFHETVIQVFFVLLKRNFIKQDDPIVRKQLVNQIFDDIFSNIIVFTKDQQLIPIGQKFIVEAVGWGARSKYFPIIKGLQKCIIGVYNELSFIAIKGIKTFIQLINPKIQSEWSILTSILLELIEDCRIKSIKEIGQIQNLISNVDLINFIRNNHGIKNIGPNINSDYLMNKLLIQKYCIELLPNDPKCITNLHNIYEQLKKYNDNIYLRCILWKKGLGKGSLEIPGLLMLQQLIINRILSIYNFNKNNLQQFYDFVYEIFVRYVKNCQDEKNIETQLNNPDNDNLQYEIFTLYIQDLKKKKKLLEKIIGYLLPKLLENNIKAQTALRLGQQLINIIQYYEPRDSAIKVLKNISKVAQA